MPRIIVDPVSGKIGGQVIVYLYRFRIGQQTNGNHTTQKNSQHKKQIPHFFFPIVFKKLDVGGNAGRTNMAERRTDTKRFIANDEQYGNCQSDQRTRYVPGPGLFYKINNTHITSIFILLRSLCFANFLHL